MKKIRNILGIFFQLPFVILGFVFLILIYLFLIPLSFLEIPKKKLLACLKPSLYILYIGIRVGEFISGER